MLYPYEEAEPVSRAWREATLQSPDTVAPELGLWNIPADPAIPGELHGSRVVLAAAVYAGPPAEAQAVLAPLRELGKPLDDQSGVVNYVDVQSAFDAIAPAGGRYYMNSHFMDELSDAAIARLLE